MTYKDTQERTSSPGSEDGTTRSNLPGGQMTFQFGPGAALVSPSATRAPEEASTTNGTFGPSGLNSSKPLDLLSSLGSKYQALTRSLGGTLYRLTWKTRVTPAGRLIYAQRASGRRTSDKGYFGQLLDVKAPAGWPTPMTEECNRSEAGRRRRVQDGRQTSVADAVHLAGWPTPCQQDGPHGGPSQGADRLPGCVHLAGWATPTTRDHKDGAAEGTAPINALLGRQAWLTHAGPVVLRASGPSPIGYTAETVNGDRLNPEHSRWLMGYPAEWASCAPMVTPSSRKLRQP